jgi:drug/metabolite transporter (DMT)-like permease
LIHLLSAIVAGLNVAITFGLVLYSLKTRSIYKGDMFKRSVSFFTRSAVFFFLAAVLRISLVLEIIPNRLEPLEIGTRSVAFLLLFAFAVNFFRDWSRARARWTTAI